jgi:aryl-alcohol dehydrogenase-like predicted oxidoreductase
MIIKSLGETGIGLSTMGLGTWAIGGGEYQYGWGPQDDLESIDTIHRAIDLGINWLDTAPVYGLGHAEEVVGKAIKGLKDNVFIASKCGFRWDNNRELSFSLKKDSIRFELEASLKRLDLEAIDLYMIHKPLPEEDIEEGWNTLVELKKEGKIRFAGVSSFSLQQLQRIHAIHPVSFIQPVYSIIQNETQEQGILDFCAENNIGVVVYSPMGSGLLTGKFTKERVENLPADDWRLKEAYFFQEPDLSVNLKLVERLRPFAEKNNKTLAQLAIAWVLRRPEVTSAIVGARRPGQIEQTIPAGDWVLSDSDKAELKVITDEYYEEIKIIKAGSDT